MSGPCHIVTLPDGTQVRIQGGEGPDPAYLETLVDAARAEAATECHELSAVPMPEIAQRIHERETYWCGLKRGHNGPHRWPARNGSLAEWTAP